MLQYIDGSQPAHRKNGLVTNSILIAKKSSYTQQSQSSAFSLLRDGALLAYLILSLTANVDLLILREAQTFGEVPGTSLFSQVTAACFLSVGVFLQVANRWPVRRLILAAAPILLMIIWVLLSVTWSDFPDVSVRRAGRLAVETTTVILFATSYRDQYRLLRVIYFSFGFILAADIALLSIPDLSFTLTGYAGVHASKQNSGLFCLLALPLFLLAIIDRRIFPFRVVSVFLLIGCLTILTISLSKSAQVLAPICLILISVIYLLGRASSLTTSIIILIFSIVAIIVAVIIVSVGIDDLLKIAFGDPTLTGRDQIWQYMLSLFWQSPIVGHGYGAVWSVGIVSVLQLPQMSETFVLREGHNGYLDVMTESGIVGLGLTVIVLTNMLYRLWMIIPYENCRRINFVAIYTFLAIALEDMVQSNIFRSGNGFWIYFLLVTYASIFAARTGPRLGSVSELKPRPSAL